MTDAIEIVKQWIDSFIVEQQICPFAKPSVTADQILYRVNVAIEMEDQIAAVIFLMNDLIEQPHFSNAFLIFENEYPSFETYLDFFYETEAIIKELNYALDFQIVSFHPNYQFAGLDMNDSANQRNQSPLPMIHILRVEEVAKAIEGIDTDAIVQRNIEYLREKHAQG